MEEKAKKAVDKKGKIWYKNNAGENNEEEIPVPMPNTEVKLLGAEDTCELPCWENRKLPVFIFIKKEKYSPIAQLVERSAVNR